MIKHLILTTALVLSLSSVVNAQEGSSSAELAAKIELAKKYSAAVPVETEIANSIEKLVLQVPVDQRALFKSILQRFIKADRLRTVSELALAETFTQDELKAMVAFYETPEGKAVREKMGLYQEKMQPIMEQMVRDAVESFQAQTR